MFEGNVWFRFWFNFFSMVLGRKFGFDGLKFVKMSVQYCSCVEFLGNGA